jgi:hypothetical protein
MLRVNGKVVFSCLHSFSGFLLNRRAVASSVVLLALKINPDFSHPSATFF